MTFSRADVARCSTSPLLTCSEGAAEIADAPTSTNPRNAAASAEMNHINQPERGRKGEAKGYVIRPSEFATIV
ncbi:hypothetical protein [Lentzea aerocolonigenes]|uniref:hypothetical protein n=1 Tax=Lentzea aerocolonigenes TaxID=68170 RepID=UPI0012DE3D81|nr:hypothetical protein [Lentzea aerocolonigenes]